MILEHADICIDPARAAEFEKAIAQGVQTVIGHAKGYIGHQVQRCIETPGRYVLLIRWETLEDHTVAFRGSEAFTAWRGIVGPFFLEPPVVEHFDAVDA